MFCIIMEHKWCVNKYSFMFMSSTLNNQQTWQNLTITCPLDRRGLLDYQNLKT